MLALSAVDAIENTMNRLAQYSMINNYRHSKAHKYLLNIPSENMHPLAILPSRVPSRVQVAQQFHMIVQFISKKCLFSSRDR